jgi:hypothetical protein
MKKTLKLKVAWKPENHAIMVKLPALPDDDEGYELALPAEYMDEQPYFEGLTLQGEPVTEERPSIVGTRKFTRPATDRDFDRLLAKLFPGGEHRPPQTVPAKLTELATYSDPYTGYDDEARVMIDIGPANYIVVLYIKVSAGEYGGPDELSGRVVPVIPPVEMAGIERMLTLLVQMMYPEIEITI